MNQFVPIFRGGSVPEALSGLTRAVNYQSCVRVGGKHNDLDEVGRDTYHHTLFDMLGNWSFGDYSKEAACGMAWDLLTRVYRLPRDRMYVTYFSGCDVMGLEPDTETRDVWRRLGVPDGRILPCGARDNFWEMGATGPCGPCTEIHFDRGGSPPWSGALEGAPQAGGARDAAQLVNSGCPDVPELWNLVFIQYHRGRDGALSRLPRQHVDTGMGLERLTAVLQGKTSNYDTDLFMPVIDAVQQISGAALYTGRVSDDSSTDVAYRVISDHARMMSLVIADGLLPDKQDLGHKLRTVMYRGFGELYGVLGAPRGSMERLVEPVIQTLGEFYPQLRNNYNKIRRVIGQTEEQYWTNVRTKKPTRAEPGAPSPRPVGTVDAGRTPAPFLDPSPHSPLTNLTPTDDQYKYYVAAHPTLTSSVRAILTRGGDVIESAGSDVTVGVVTERSNFYSAGGGQVSDTGVMVTDQGAELVVEGAERCGDHVIHVGHVTRGQLRTGDDVIMTIDQDRRRGCMRAHTGTHVLHATLRHVLGDDVTQRGSHVVDDQLTFDFSHVEKLTPALVARIQSELDLVIRQSVSVSRRQMALAEAERLPGLARLPGEAYPPLVHVVEIPAVTSHPEQVTSQVETMMSRELCGGTHVTNTADLVAMVITNVSGVSQGTKRISALTGDAALQAREESRRLREHVEHLAEDVKTKTRPDHWPQRFKAIDTVLSTQTLERAVKDEVYSVFDSLRSDAAGYLNKLARDAWAQDIYRAVTSSPRDQLTVLECDFSSAKQMIKVLQKLNLTRPVLVHAPLTDAPDAEGAPDPKGAPTWQCVAWVPPGSTFTACDWLQYGLAEVTSGHHVTKQGGCGVGRVKGAGCRKQVIDRFRQYNR